jgi:hypothetical protein
VKPLARQIASASSSARASKPAEMFAAIVKFTIIGGGGGMADADAPAARRGEASRATTRLAAYRHLACNRRDAIGKSLMSGIVKNGQY